MGAGVTGNRADMTAPTVGATWRPGAGVNPAPHARRPHGGSATRLRPHAGVNPSAFPLKPEDAQLSRPCPGAGVRRPRAPPQLRWIGSIHFTPSGFSTGSMSRFTTTGSCPERTITHSSVSSGEALISWWGT